MLGSCSHVALSTQHVEACRIRAPATYACRTSTITSLHFFTPHPCIFQLAATRPTCCSLPWYLLSCSDKDLANVAAVSAGGNPDVGKLISDAMAKVGACVLAKGVCITCTVCARGLRGRKTRVSNASGTP